jgi:hypothetical protein
MPPAQLGDRGPVRRADRASGRVVGGVEQQYRGLVGDRLGERGDRQVPVGGRQVDQPCDPACAVHEREICVVQWLDEHDFITGPNQREQRRGKRLGRAGGYDDFIACDRKPLFALIIFDDRGPQGGEAPHRRILARSFGQCARGGIEQLGRAVADTRHVREALPQIDRAEVLREPRLAFEDGRWRGQKAGIPD